MMRVSLALSFGAVGPPLRPAVKVNTLRNAALTETIASGKRVSFADLKYPIAAQVFYTESRVISFLCRSSLILNTRRSMLDLFSNDVHWLLDIRCLG